MVINCLGIVVFFTAIIPPFPPSFGFTAHLPPHFFQKSFPSFALFSFSSGKLNHFPPSLFSFPSGKLNHFPPSLFSFPSGKLTHFPLSLFFSFPPGKLLLPGVDQRRFQVKDKQLIKLFSRIFDKSVRYPLQKPPHVHCT